MAWACASVSSPSEFPNVTRWNSPLLPKKSLTLQSHYRISSFKELRNSPSTNVSRSQDQKRCNRTKQKFSSSLIHTEHECYEATERARQNKKQLTMNSVRTLLIDNYDSYTYNIFQLLAIVNGVDPTVVTNDELTWEQISYLLYEKHAFDNIVISPGPGTPACHADIGICMKILFECKDIPILGVCLGHQALGYAHGAKIIHAPQPVHGRLSEIQHSNSDIFSGIPSGAGSGFNVVRYHSLVIDAFTLPNDLIPIAWTSYLDPVHPCSHTNYHQAMEQKMYIHKNTKLPKLTEESRFLDVTRQFGVLMGIMHKSRPHYGLQFHPESIATCYGKKILENFRNITARYWFKSHNVNQQMSKYIPLKACLEDNQSVSMKSKEAYVRREMDKFNASSRSHVESNAGKKQHTALSLRWKKLAGFATRAGGSANIFRNIFGNDSAKNTFWLDSSSIDNGKARFSFMGGKGGPLWRCISFHLSNRRAEGDDCGGYVSIEDGSGSIHSYLLQTGFFEFLEEELESFMCSKEDYQELPFDFYGGYIGYIGYELKVECGMQHNHSKSRLPDACFFLADRLLVIDHMTDDVYILSVSAAESNGNMDQDHQHKSSSRFVLNASPDNFPDSRKDNGSCNFDGLFAKRNGTSNSITDSEEWMEVTERKLIQLIEKINNSRWRKEKASSPSMGSSTGEQQETFMLKKSRMKYLEDVRKCIEYIVDGESYELCLTSQFSKRITMVDKLQLYLTLREKNPAPYAAWLNFESEDLCICSSSPERFLKLDRDGVLEAKPIKGTISRGKSRTQDEELRVKLRHSEKDQAENLMIVDLIRNDLGRVCEPGTVHVPILMEVESYATVHTLVSTIRGQKTENASPVDCVRAAFPGGSMTGAPKRRAMEILDSIEKSPRGVYSGAIGYFSFNKTFDLNIVIRTIVLNGNEVSVGAGGAVVSLSNPEDEYNEMTLKARVPIAVVNEIERQAGSLGISKEQVE